MAQDEENKKLENVEENAFDIDQEDEATRNKENLAKFLEAKVEIKLLSKDVDVFMNELEVEQYVAEKWLRSNNGSLKEAIQAYIAV